MGSSESKEMFIPPSNPSSKTKNKYLQAIENQAEALALIDSKGNYEGFNKLYIELFGFDSLEIATITLRNLLTLSKEEQPQNQEVSLQAIKLKIGKALSEGENHYQWIYQTMSDKDLEVFVWINPIRLKDSLYLQVLIRPKGTESTVSNIDESLIDVQVSAREIGDFCLQEAVRITNSEIGHLSFINKKQDLLQTYGFSKNVMEQCNTLKKQLVFNLPNTGLWGESVRQRKPVITNDYSKPNPYKKGVPNGHVPISRYMCVPVFRNEDKKRVVLTVGVANKKDPYTMEDAQNIEDLMYKMWQIFQKKYNL
ncbi:hypothetical protein M0811_13532 [Anaeramoeba ignava]|uniref:GAF domain-containing protein n=1 Tax=Anaeramoeba ignava TaxID=1746090 RepID=A0A9Q0R501_ANAIG|nr:hypothetical protein M0811_13532 [Anaeramoeba ignava]